METSRTIQTGIRMDFALYEKLKRNAKRERRSVNNYIVNILEKSVDVEIPKLQLKDFQVDSDIQSLGKTMGAVTDEKLDNDPKLQYILSK